MTDYIEGLIQTITELRNENAMLQAHIDRLTDEVVKRPTEAQLNSLKSQIRQNLTEAFGLPALDRLEIASVGRRPDTRFGICMDRYVIEVVV